MSVNPDIHDKAYQFFIEEATELLQIIEDGILELRRDRGANTVHAVMRAAHSIKGGAASVELEAIKAIAHRMETAFRALYDETVEIDDELEGLLLDGFDCLKDPLNEQIETGSHDPEAALLAAMPIIEALEANLGAEALKQADNYIPSSSDLGIDMVTSIFEIDVEEGIAHLEEIAATPENFPVLGELQAQAEVFVGFGELLDLPGFGAISQAILDACHNSPADPIGLLTIALQDLQAAKALVMGGDRDQGGAPSEALLALAGSSGGGDGADEAVSDAAALPQGLSAGDFADFGLSEADLANFDFGAADLGGVDLSSAELSNADLGNADLGNADLGNADLGNADLGDVGLNEAGDGENLSALGDLSAFEDLSVLEAEPGESIAPPSDPLAELAIEPAAEFVGLEANAIEGGSDGETNGEVDDFVLGADDFQALIDESGSLGLVDIDAKAEAGGEAEAEAEAVASHDIAEALVDTSTEQPESLLGLEDAALLADDNSVDNDSADAAAFNSLDAMAQLADLMAAPDTESSLAESGEEHLEQEALIGEAEKVEPEVPEAADAIAPDAELENMWTELSEDIGTDPAEVDDHSNRDLDTAFDIAMDRASMDLPEIAPTAVPVAQFMDSTEQSEVEQSEVEQPEVEQPEVEQPEVDTDSNELADVFAEEVILLTEGQDATMALSTAEADAAFEAMVDGSATIQNDAADLDDPDDVGADAFLALGVLDDVGDNDVSDRNLNLNDDEAGQDNAEEEAGQDNADASDADETLPLGLFADEQSLVGTANEIANSASLELLDPWASLAVEAPAESESMAEQTAPSAAAEELAEEPFEEGTYIQGLEMGTFVQAEIPEPTAAQRSSDSEANSPEAFEEGTVIQGFDEGTYIQEVTAEPAEPAELEQPSAVERFDESTYVQGDEAEAPIQSLPGLSDDDAIADDWQLPAEAGKLDEPLIPELQDFIAQAAAESAGSVEKQTAALAVDELIGAETGATEAPVLDSLESEATEPGVTEPGVAAPEVTGSEVAESEITEPAVAELELEMEAAGADVVASAPERTAEATAEIGVEPEVVASQGNEALPLPSLDTIFAVPPEQLAAIASDSLTSKPIDDAAADSEPELKPEPELESKPEPEQVPSEEVAVRDAEDTAQTEAPPLTPTAVEVALAEHQLVEPAVAPGEESQAKADRISDAILAAEELFSQLPVGRPAEAGQTQNGQAEGLSAQPNRAEGTQADIAHEKSGSETKEATKSEKKKRQQNTKLSGISVRVDLSVLERMNNLVGELVLSRNSLSLQHEQLQSVVTQLDKRFSNFEGQLNGLRGLSDQMLVEPAQRTANSTVASQVSGLAGSDAKSEGEALLEGFDVLEMDRYSALHGQLQEIFEQLMQLEEGVDDISVLLEQSTQSLTQQRQRLSLLQNELMWARMLPLDNILGRFPRVLRDMARKHSKSVDLNLNGTSVLVDKGMLEKLHDPMLHLLRNAFDHGIEKPDARKQQGKPERGEIQINAYYQGNQTVIEIKDDGQGINLERIAKRAIELQWLSRDEIKSVPQQALLDLIFEPGFSTAAQLSELSGRGVGLDVVREQIKGLKGSVTVDFEPGQGTTFTLRLPLTLTVAKLMVCQVETTAIAIPSDGIEDLLVPQPEQLKIVGDKRLLHWRDELIPIQPMADLLDYSCPTADIASLKSITSKSIPVPQDWALPLLIFSRGSQRCAMEVNRLLMEQELVIKPFSSAMTPPDYSYGCTILGDGRMIPVLDGNALLQQLSHNSVAVAAGVELDDDLLEGELNGTETAATMAQAMQAETLLVVDDSTAMRRTMALSLEKAGYRVLQAGDGQEALTQLRQSSAIQLVICDVEMPNMNGFEFLSQRRREPSLMKIPVVMLTSRSSDKHRRLAMQLKAHDYFSKPYVEQDFITSIKQILTAQQGAVAKV